MINWINASDNLPSENDVVTCLLSDGSEQDCFILEGEWESVDVNYSDAKVTHWKRKE